MFLPKVDAPLRFVFAPEEPTVYTQVRKTSSTKDLQWVTLASQS